GWSCRVSTDRFDLGVRIRAADGKATGRNSFPVARQRNPDGGTKPFDLLQFLHPHQRKLWRRLSGASYGSLAGHGRGAYRTTLSFDPDRNPGGNVVTGAV